MNFGDFPFKWLATLGIWNKFEVLEELAPIVPSMSY